MITIKELKMNNQSIFMRTYATSNNVVLEERTFYYRLYKPKIEEYTNFVLYDDNMCAISTAFDYLNIELATSSYNTREQYAHALRLLYCFLDITNTKLGNMKKSSIDRLIYFLLGYSPNNGSFSVDMLTTRKNATVNGYLSVYRDYLSFLGINCAPLFDNYIIKRKGIDPISENSTDTSHYISNLKTGTPVNRVPKYISIFEFSKIIELCRKDNNLLAECILRLLFQFGLRIGEVLGLTCEDLVEIEIDGTLYPVLFIRNRVSDSSCQKAKSCMNIYSRNQYNSKNYITKSLGYQVIIITWDIFELLNESIELFHGKARKHNLIRYNNSVRADTTIQNKYATDNYYIFLNSYGKVLTAQTWNKYLKNIFKLAGIMIDRKYKEASLNHRFRHGFAMFHVQHRKTPLLELKELMRHACISSTMIYYNPTEEDEAKIKNNYVT